MKTFRGLIAIGAIACSLAANGQSVYVDLDVQGGGWGGPPSSSFAGAADAPGQWNSIPADDQGPLALFDTDGQNTGVSVSWLGGAGALGYFNPINTGDYARLLNDAEEVGDWVHFTVSGLRAGSYRIYTFAVEPQGNLVTTDVTVPGSIEGTLAVTGPMPGNQLIDRITHSVHSVQLDGGPLMINASGDPNRSYVNGFQIELVPEPATISTIALGLAAIAVRRKKRM